MTISGFQAVSLVDYPERPCAIIFTQGCVFRCGYCHNPDLIPLKKEGRYTTDEIVSRLVRSKKMVDAVCITGGEPTIHHGLLPFVQRLKETGFKVKLDTNGIRPLLVAQLIERGLVDYFAMDIKAPWEKYPEVIGEERTGLVEACRQTFQLIQSSGIDHEFRTTIHPLVHTKDDILTIAEYLKPGEKYYIQETSFKTTLDGFEPQQMPFDARALLDTYSSLFPNLFILVR